MRKVFKSLSGIIITLILFLSSLNVFAEDDGNEWTYVNDETGYTAVLLDMAGVVETGDERDLEVSLKGLTAYGNAMCLTAVASGYADDSAARAVAKDYYERIFGMKTGLVAAVVLDRDLEPAGSSLRQRIGKKASLRSL